MGNTCVAFSGQNLLHFLMLYFDWLTDKVFQLLETIETNGHPILYFTNFSVEYPENIKGDAEAPKNTTDTSEAEHETSKGGTSKTSESKKKVMKIKTTRAPFSSRVTNKLSLLFLFLHKNPPMRMIRVQRGSVSPHLRLLN